MLRLVLPNTRVILANQQLFIDTFVDGGPVRGQLVLGVLYLAGVRERIGSGTGNGGLVVVPTVAVHTEGPLLAVLLLFSNIALSLVGVVLLGSRLIKKVFEDSCIITLLATKVTR